MFPFVVRPLTSEDKFENTIERIMAYGRLKTDIFTLNGKTLMAMQKPCKATHWLTWSPEKSKGHDLKIYPISLNYAQVVRAAWRKSGSWVKMMRVWGENYVESHIIPFFIDISTPCSGKSPDLVETNPFPPPFCQAWKGCNWIQSLHWHFKGSLCIFRNVKVAFIEL